MNPLQINRNKSFTIDGAVWHVKVPLPYEDRIIDVEVSRKLGGQPLESIPRQTRNYVEICTTLNFVIVNKPAGFEWIEDFESIPDFELVTSIWEEYAKIKNKFYEEISSLKKNQNRGNGRGNLSGSLPDENIQIDPGGDTDSGRSIPGTKTMDFSDNGPAGLRDDSKTIGNTGTDQGYKKRVKHAEISNS
ncbi:MAG: hypothetical protein KDK45_25475 [Leptospiraceae bacterium]|nr:hypothetical protein [Leptospiraceae bacterium]